MTTSYSAVSLETLLNLVHNSQDSLKLLECLKQSENPNKRPPITSIIATFIVTDLYNEFSSDDANINRITTNLDAAANDLLMIAERIRKHRNKF